ncbi:TrbC/VirB2 family protein [Staphylococcus epidermidis]|uniref:TrbC/VirB2 family protein n=1 Tax=Staphylococcus epidermidis TaxID=1282 RepID=UPI0034D602C4
MKELFEPIKEMLKDAVSGFMGLVNTVAVLGIIICAVGTLFGSQQAKEKFKSGFFWIVIAFIAINLARQIVNAIGGYL